MLHGKITGTSETRRQQRHEYQLPIVVYSLLSGVVVEPGLVGGHCFQERAAHAGTGQEEALRERLKGACRQTQQFYASTQNSTFVHMHEILESLRLARVDIIGPSGTCPAEPSRTARLQAGMDWI